MKYNLTLIVNDETKKKRTDDLKKALLSMVPEVLYTEVYVIVQPVGSREKTKRRLGLRQAMRTFRDENNIDFFINNLLFDY